MSKTQKYGCFIMFIIVNVFFFFSLGFWKYILKGDMFVSMGQVVSVILGIILGINAILVLALSGTSIIIQLYYRKKYEMYERKCLDNSVKIQIILLIFYYITSIVFFIRVSNEKSMMYLTIMPILLAIPLIKMGKTVWHSGDIIIYMNENGQLINVDEMCIGDNDIEFIYKSGNIKVKKTGRIKRLYKIDGRI